MNLLLQLIFGIANFFKSRNRKSGNGMKGMQGMGVGMQEKGVGMWGIWVFSQMLRFSCNDPNKCYYLNGMWTCTPSVWILFQRF